MTNAAIGAWKCRFPPFLREIIIDRPTNQPTDTSGHIRDHGKVTLPISDFINVHMFVKNIFFFGIL